MLSRRLFSIALGFWCAFLINANAQSTPTEPSVAKPEENSADQQALVTVHGSVDLNSIPANLVKLDEFPAELVEHIELKPLPLPANWDAMALEQRDQWLAEFPQTEQGQSFLAEREALEQKRKRYKIRFETNGEFLIDDVQPAMYDIFGRMDVVHDSKKYAVELYGQIEIGAVDEVQMPALPFDVTRILTQGESAPDLTVQSLSGLESIELKSLRGRPVLVTFWSAGLPTAESDIEALQRLHDRSSSTFRLEILAICSDTDLAPARAIVEKKSVQWLQGASQGWNHPLFAEYGIRSIPTYVLIDAEGKIALAPDEFFAELGKGERDLPAIVAAALAGEIPKSTDR